MIDDCAAAAFQDVGVVLLDSLMCPVGFNNEAVRILSYPQKPHGPKGLGADDLGEKIRASLSRQPLRSTSQSELTSGRRRYLCRAFALDPGGKGTRRGPSVVVLLERDSRGTATLATMTAQFQFTRREQETLDLLSNGLDTKDIANSMHISTNTAKVYIHMVMAKMRVSSRLEVLARILSAKGPGPMKHRPELTGRYRAPNTG